MKKALMLSALIAGLALSAGCFQQDGVTKKVTQGNTANNLVVSNNVSFDFFDNVKVNLKGQAGTAVQIYNEKPGVESKPVVTDLLDEDGNFSDELSVESNGTLYFVSPNGEFADTQVAIVNGNATATLLSNPVAKKRAGAIVNPEWVGKKRRLMFEDKNTDTTDFDFNDVVVDYSYLVNNEYVNTQVGNKTKKVKYIKSAVFTFDAIANGANESDGFGFKLDQIEASKIDRVTIGGVPATFTAVGTDKVVVYVVKNLIEEFGGKLTNTSGSYVHSKRYQVEISFKNSAYLAGKEVSFRTQINPFIFKSNNVSLETHIEPKESVDGSVKNYTNSNGLPWAMELPTNVGYPKERIPITDAYEKFASFAIGNDDSENKKWYKYPKEGTIYITE